MHKFWFAGKCSYDMGIYISGDNVFNAPERDTENVEINGRNGDLLIDNGRYKNITVSYPCFIRQKFFATAAATRNWLTAETGYQRLEDTYNKDTYRLARFAGGVNFDVHLLKAGEMDLAFDCKPQRFLKAGEYPIEMTESGILHNPTNFDALPLITVYGTSAGQLNINGAIVQIKSIDGHVTLDSDMQNAYKDTANKNNTILADDFPVLKRGSNALSWSGGITKVEIIPRWWTL